MSIIWFLYKIGIFVSGIVPRKIMYLIATILGYSCYYLCRMKRKILYENLKPCINNEKALWNTIRKIFVNYAKYYGELFWYLNKSPDQLKTLIQIKGWEHIDGALKEGKGAIIITMHIGNWDIGGAALGLKYSANVLVERLKSKALYDLFLNIREKFLMKPIPIDTAYERLISALKQNEVVVIVADRDISRGGSYVNFLGRETLMPKGAVLLALRTHAPIIPAFLIRDNDKLYGTIDKPIEIIRRTSIKDTIVINLIRITQYIEGIIMKYPDQWCMLQPLQRKV